MKGLLLLLPAVLACSVMSWSRAPSDSVNSHDLAAASPAQDSTTTTDSLAAGTVLSAELSKQVDAKKYKVNDKVEARVVTDLLVHGQVVVHRNTKIIGHVTEVKASSKASPGSTVGIALDRMLLKGGREVPLVMMIQAIARPLHVPGYGSGPDSLADKPTTPLGLPPVGAQAPAAGSSSLTPNYPYNIPAPPSINAGGPSSSIVYPLGSTSRGVVGMKGLSLSTSGPISLLSSSTGNLHLDAGTQLTPRVQ
jgi:hypothetical protein